MIFSWNESNTTFIFHSARHRSTIKMTFDLYMLGLIGCVYGQSGTLRTAGRPDLWGLGSGSQWGLEVLNWNQQRRSLHCCCCCCCCCCCGCCCCCYCCCCWCFWWCRGALCQPGTSTRLLCLAAGCGERPASPAAGRTEALCSCTSCCRDAPCLCCCRRCKQKGDEELKQVYKSI